jgi:glutamate dehydrogenase (NADP+)
VRTEATGYGLVYNVTRMLADRGTDWKGKKVVVSGSGNVAIYAAEKAQQLGARVIAMSDSAGYVVDESGIKVGVIKHIKEVERGRIKDYPESQHGSVYKAGCQGIWAIPCDIALPSATQNEIDAQAAQLLAANGCIAVGEGANMPSTPEAIRILQDAGVSFGPAKAANAGGVATSALEMCQNSMRLNWTFQEVDARLKLIMNSIYDQGAAAAEAYATKGDLVAGSNIAGFLKVAEAMMAHGIV